MVIRMKINSIILVFLCVFLGCKALIEKDPLEICYNHDFSQSVEKVSFKNPEEIKKLNRKFVEIEGIFRYNFEDVALYPTKESRSTEAVWLNLKIPDTIPDSLLNQLNERKVIIIGRVNILDKGHDNAYLAALDSAFCIKQK